MDIKDSNLAVNNFVQKLNNDLVLKGFDISVVRHIMVEYANDVVTDKGFREEFDSINKNQKPYEFDFREYKNLKIWMENLSKLIHYHRFELNIIAKAVINYTDRVLTDEKVLSENNRIVRFNRTAEI